MPMRIAYYPGCSLEATGRAYDESARAVAEQLGIALEELKDWNCCGATSYMSVKELLSLSISARNLSLAEREGLDIVAPCSACFTVLRKTDHYLQEMPELKSKVDAVLGAAGLSYTPGSVRVRHLMELLFHECGVENIRKKTTRPLSGLRVAPYYGCQVVRPKVDFDDLEMPTTLDRMMQAIGAFPVYYPLKTRCCGASLMASNEAAALRLCRNLLLNAQQNGAECIVTVCPLCQMNLEGFQDQINAMFGTSFKIPVLYFTQLIGFAMGLAPSTLGLGRELVGSENLLARFLELPRLASPAAATP